MFVAKIFKQKTNWHKNLKNTKIWHFWRKISLKNVFLMRQYVAIFPTVRGLPECTQVF